MPTIQATIDENTQAAIVGAFCLVDDYENKKIDDETEQEFCHRCISGMLKAKILEAERIGAKNTMRETLEDAKAMIDNAEIAIEQI